MAERHDYLVDFMADIRAVAFEGGELQSVAVPISLLETEKRFEAMFCGEVGYHRLLDDPRAG